MENFNTLFLKIYDADDKLFEIPLVSHITILNEVSGTGKTSFFELLKKGFGEEEPVKFRVECFDENRISRYTNILFATDGNELNVGDEDIVFVDETNQFSTTFQVELSLLPNPIVSIKRGDSFHFCTGIQSLYYLTLLFDTGKPKVEIKPFEKFKPL